MWYEFFVAIATSGILLSLFKPALAKKIFISTPFILFGFVQGTTRGNLPMYREIYRNLTWRNLIDFSLFKLRLLAARHLETGLISKRPGTGPAVYDLTYFEGSTKYTLRFTKLRGPCPFSHVTTTTYLAIDDWSGDVVEKDVTENIRRFAGPSHNFYGIPTTPKLLEYPNLTFHFRKGSSVRFESDDVISVALVGGGGGFSSTSQSKSTSQPSLDETSPGVDPTASTIEPASTEDIAL